MDVNETLRRLRDLSSHANAYDDSPEWAELVEALDEWLCRGGFMPDAWARGPAAGSRPHVVVDLESGDRMPLGLYVDTLEDVIRYRGPSGELRSAPGDCVEVIAWS